MVDELKRMFGRLPVETAPTAFALRADIAEVRVFASYGRQYLPSLPLESHTAHGIAQLAVGKNLLDVIQPVCIERSDIQPDIGMRALERGQGSLC